MATGHRLFAALWDRATRVEPGAMRALRSEVAGRTTGRVLEIGAGTGANQPHLAPGVNYIGVEPDPHMRRRALAHARAEGRNLQLVGAVAEALPFADAVFDSVFLTVVLCSVDDQARTLAEIMRVLKPGGSFHYLEHVRPGSVLGTAADAVTPVWSRCFGNCHPNRRTGAAIRNAGFLIDQERHIRHNTLPAIVGVARKPAASN